MIKCGCKHFRNTNETNIKIIHIPDCSLSHLFKIYVLISIDIFSIMIGNESSFHSPNFDLHNVFKESSANKIKILSLKTFIYPSNFVYFVIFIVKIILNIVSNWCTSSWFYLKNKRISILVIWKTIYLWSKHHLAINFHISVIIIDIMYLFSSHESICLLFFVGQKILYDVTQLKKYAIVLRHNTFIIDNSLNSFSNIR